MHACLVLFSVRAVRVFALQPDDPWPARIFQRCGRLSFGGGLGLSLRARDADVLGHVTQE
jgi:hypothetical protein